MKVVESVMGNAAVLAPLGARLDASGCGEFRRRLEQAVARGHRRVILDLSAVDFMDSTGLAAILGALRTLAKTGRIACSGLRPEVRKLFEVTRLDRGLVDIHPSVEAAVAAFADTEGTS